MFPNNVGQRQRKPLCASQSRSKALRVAGKGITFAGYSEADSVAYKAADSPTMLGPVAAMFRNDENPPLPRGVRLDLLLRGRNRG